MIKYTIAWSGSYGPYAHGDDSPVLVLETDHDRNLAARILDAFQWAAHMPIDIKVFSRHTKISNGPSCVEGKDLLEAIEALRAKVEPAVTTSSQLFRDKTEEYDMRETTPATRPDKRVPAFLVVRLLGTLDELHFRNAAAELKACPDIVDESAALHPTAQAVLDAADALRADECTDEDVCDTVEVWRAAGRPTVVPARCRCTHEAGDSDCPVHESCSDCGACGHGCKEMRFISAEDAATLAALHECRELGLSARLFDDGSWVWPTTGKYVLGKGPTLPEALAAFKAAQVKVKDGWYWTENNKYRRAVREIRNGDVMSQGKCDVPSLGPASDFTIGPECPPPPKVDE